MAFHIEAKRPRLAKMAMVTVAGRLNRAEKKSGGGDCGLQEDVQVVGVDGAELRVFAVDLAGVDELDEGFFEGEGSLLFCEGDFLMQVLQGVFADVVASAVTDDEQFGGRDAASALSGEQNLRVDGGEGHSQLLANGVLPFERK